MFGTCAQKKENRWVAVLHQLQYRLDQGEQPTPRSAELTETEFQEMAAAKLFRLEKLEEDGDVLDNFVICDLLYPAQVLLAKHPSPISPIQRVQSQPPPVSPAARLFSWLGSKLWEIVRMAFSAVIGAVAGWYLKKHFP